MTDYTVRLHNPNAGARSAPRHATQGWIDRMRTGWVAGSGPDKAHSTGTKLRSLLELSGSKKIHRGPALENWKIGKMTETRKRGAAGWLRSVSLAMQSSGYRNSDG
jgi:hypothetical protein